MNDIRAELQVMGKALTTFGPCKLTTGQLLPSLKNKKFVFFFRFKLIFCIGTFNRYPLFVLLIVVKMGQIPNSSYFFLLLLLYNFVIDFALLMFWWFLWSRNVCMQRIIIWSFLYAILWHVLPFLVMGSTVWL